MSTNTQSARALTLDGVRAGFRLTAIAGVRVTLVDVVTVAVARAVAVGQTPAVVVALLLALGARVAVVTLAVLGHQTSVRRRVLVDERAVVATFVARHAKPALQTSNRRHYMCQIDVTTCKSQAKIKQ